MISQDAQGKRHLWIDQIVYIGSGKAQIHSSKSWIYKIAVGENLSPCRENLTSWAQRDAAFQ